MTQSLNGMIWKRLPKSTLVGATLLELVVYEPVARFNVGLGGAMSILPEEGLYPGCYFQ